MPDGGRNAPKARPQGYKSGWAPLSRCFQAPGDSALAVRVGICLLGEQSECGKLLEIILFAHRGNTTIDELLGNSTIGKLIGKSQD